MKALLRLLALWLLLASAQASTELWTTREGREKVFDAVVDVFTDYYWDPGYTDWQGWSARFREAALDAPSRPAFDSVFRRMVQSLEDDHSSWLGLVSYVGDTSLAQPLRPRLGMRTDFLAGVGVVVQRVYPGTPAEGAGLRRGDVITAVGAHDLSRLGSSYEALAVLGDAIGEGEVELTVQRRRASRTVTVVPAPIDEGLVEELPQAEMLDASTGYLYVPTFRGPEVGREVHRLVRSLQEQGAVALVLDLRGNLGGRLGELGLVLGAFVDGDWGQAVSRGEIVWRGRYLRDGGRGVSLLEEADGRSQVMNTVDGPVHFDGPLAVLVDGSNSSAGEIAALALQDLGRATVVGETTSGNVEAVRGFDLPDGSLVMVAVANLEGADGVSFSRGVVPDVVASATLSELARGYDAPVAVAMRLLRRLPFTPGRYF